MHNENGRENSSTTDTCRFNYDCLFDLIKSPAAVYETPDGGETFHIVEYNRGAEIITGLKREEVIGKDLTKVFQGIEKSGVLTTLRTCYKTQETQFMPSYLYEDSRIKVWTEGRFYYIPDNRVLAIYDDKTEFHMAQQRLNQSEKMESLGLMAGGVAHDFNNLLGVILGYGEMCLLQKNNPEKVEEAVLHIQKAGKKAKELISQILSFSRLEMGVKKPISLKSVVKEMEVLLQATLTKSITLDLQLDERPLMVMADAGDIYKALMNLCLNAAQAMDESGTITIKITQAEEANPIIGYLGSSPPGNYCLLEIEDHGSGIAAKHLERIFEPYFSTKVNEQGKGLGLAVVFGILQTHNANILVESKIHEGSRFSIYFPLLEQTALGMIPQDLESLEGHESLLVVDDELDITDILSQMLTPLGYKVTCYNDSLQALQLFKKEPQAFDLVITDQIMPKLEGVGLAARILELRPDLPIILCTGYSKSITRDDVLAAGIRSFLMKPLGLKNLAREIRSLLDG